MSKSEKRVLRIIKKYNVIVPVGADSSYKNIVAAAEILSTKEIVQMCIEYGFLVWGAC